MIDYKEISDGAKSRDIAKDVSKELVVLSRVGWTAEKIARHLTRTGYKVGGWTVRYRMLPVARELEKDNEHEIMKLVANFKKARAKTLSAELKATLGFDFLSLNQPNLSASEFHPEKSAVRRPAPPAAEARREENEERPVARPGPSVTVDEEEMARRRAASSASTTQKARSKEEALADARSKAERREALDEAEIDALRRADNLPPEVVWWLERSGESCERDEMEWRALFDVPRMTKKTPDTFDAFEMSMLALCRRKASREPLWMALFLKRDSEGSRRSLDEALFEMGYKSFAEFTKAARR